jgi:hypothetical protein
MIVAKPSVKAAISVVGFAVDVQSCLPRTFSPGSSVFCSVTFSSPRMVPVVQVGTFRPVTVPD